jgi:D-alanyl-D-alanine carboxypeptidase
VLKRSALRIRTGSLCLLPILAIFLLSLSVFTQSASAADNKYAGLVIDANTGKTLFAKSADARRYPASLTKMMTLYVLFEELQAKRLTLSTKLKVSANAAKQPPSKIGVKAGSTIKVEDAILALVTKSANDVAVVVAEAIGGSVSGFAGRMNREARALGMNSTTFRNPHGLPDSGQYTTARDLARLAVALQDRFPSYYPYFSKRSFTYKGVRIRNHNRLLGNVTGVDGIKTGYTRASGFNLVSNVVRDRRHIVAVVMGGKSAGRRDAHMRDLIAKYLPKATRGDRTDPVLVADATSDEVTETPAAAAAAAEALVAGARTPRARPAIEAEDAAVLSYAAAEVPTDVVSQAMAETEVTEVSEDVAEAAADDETTEGDTSAADEVADPIASRIQTATAVAEFADIEIQGGAKDPIGKLTELARVRAGVNEIFAGPAKPKSSAGEGGWHIQIGAVPTAEGAEALIEKAQAKMGKVLASMQPLTLEIDRRGETLYRARFAGFGDKEAARAACQKLKRQDFSCLAVPG